MGWYFAIGTCCRGCRLSCLMLSVISFENADSAGVQFSRALKNCIPEVNAND